MSGNKRTSGFSGSSSNSRGVNQSKVRCNCGRIAILRTVKHGPNSGFKFFGCPLWPDSDCKFFKWDDLGENADDDLRYQILEKDTTIIELEHEKSLLAEKIKKLQVKKSSVEEEIQELKFELSQIRIELMKSSRNERNFSMALFFSWVLFAMLVLYLK